MAYPSCVLYTKQSEQTARTHARRAWVAKHGPIAAGIYLLHRCDEPRCINVEHLFLGDQSANRIDALIKGRIPQAHSAENMESARRFAEKWYPDLNLGSTPEAA